MQDILAHAKWNDKFTPLPLPWYLSPSSESDRVSLGHLAILTSQIHSFSSGSTPEALPVSPESYERQKVQTTYSIHKEVDMCELSPVQKPTVVRKKKSDDVMCWDFIDNIQGVGFILSLTHSCCSILQKLCQMTGRINSW